MIAQNWSIFIILCFGLSGTVYGIAYEEHMTNFHAKCQHLPRPTLYFNSSCFVSTKQSYRTNYDNWKSLHAECQHFPTYNRRLAFVYTKTQITKLIERNVVRPNISLYIGSRKVMPSNCKEEGCIDCPNQDQFSYVDEELRIHGTVNHNLWLRSQPDNRGPDRKLEERLMALEHADRFGGPANQVGFNDLDGNQNLPLLCEYKEDSKCPKDMILMKDGTCISFHYDEKGITPPEVERECKNIKHGKSRGYLPSIHSDAVNTFLANMARDLIQKNKWYDGVNKNKRSKKGKKNKFQQYWPVLFGMKYQDNRWVNMDGTQTDYFRWWSLETKTHNLFKNPAKGHKYVYLMVRTNGDDTLPVFSYWANVFKETDKIGFYLCMLKPYTTKQ